MWEPFGDNSRYWIGPEPVHWCPQIDVVRHAFAKRRFDVLAVVMWAIVLVPVTYVSACSYRSHSANAVFDSIHIGDAEATVRRAMGEPLAHETNGGPRGVPFSNGCKGRCAEIWWYENRLALDGESWSITFDDHRRVIDKVAWHSP
ncbi:hypothetical protein GCM10011408_22410 [Dyella caseinilytica]|nr:hypothetical protein GCM10011408_22410 [Dyella caseinilytica]